MLPFENEDDRVSLSKYYTPTVEIADYNVVITGKNFLDVPIKNKEKTCENIIEMSRNNDYTTDNLLNYIYFSNHYKLITINLSKQTELENTDKTQEIKFIGRLERNEGGTMFFIIEKTEETTLIFRKML